MRWQHSHLHNFWLLWRRESLVGFDNLSQVMAALIRHGKIDRAVIGISSRNAEALDIEKGTYASLRVSLSLSLPLLLLNKLHCKSFGRPLTP